MRRVWLGCLLSVVFIFCGGVARGQEPSQYLVEKAVQGDASAQFALGVMYVNGEGVRQDYVKAREWYEKAAAQGNARAQLALGVMYVNGYGVRQDNVKAREWFGKACDNGSQIGCDGYRDLNNRR